MLVQTYIYNYITYSFISNQCMLPKLEVKAKPYNKEWLSMVKSV